MIYENGKTLHLAGKNTSYVICINKYGDLTHYHYGAKIANRDYSDYTPCYVEKRDFAVAGETGLENIKQEYPAFGHIDHRKPAYTVVNGDGNAISRLYYKSHKIYDGKYSVEGMPSLFAGDSKVQTLEITLSDEIAGFDVILYYSMFEDSDVITRCTKFISRSDKDIAVTTAFSTNIDLPQDDYDAVYFVGAWSRERHMKRMNMQDGATLEISNARGSSGHTMNPFVIVCEHSANETQGAAYGFSLVYSGGPCDSCYKRP